MTPDPQKCLLESKRVLRDGGVLACSSWQGSQWMDLMNLAPRVRAVEMPKVPPEWESAGAMKTELEKAGFQDVKSYQVDTSMSFEKREVFIDFIFSKMPHMVELLKDWSEEDLKRLKLIADEEMQKMSPNEPGKLAGTALVAVGRK